MPASVPLSDSYSDVERLLDDITHRFCKSHGGNFEELRADASLHFMSVYRDYNHKKGSFSARLGYIIYYRFLDSRRKERRKKQLRITPLKKEIPLKPKGIDLFFPDLSDDAQTIVKLVFTPNKEVKTIAETGLGTRNPNSMCYAIRSFLMDCGWTNKRIYSSFSEISEALLPY